MKKAVKLSRLKAPIAVVGMGISGKSVFQLLRKMGIKEVVTFDEKEKQVDFSDHEKLLNIVKPQTLVVSPGVPLMLPWIQNFIKNDGIVTSELGVAASFLTTEKVIGITGSIGKSTTVSLLGEALKTFSKSFFVGGNLGFPLADYILELLNNKRTIADWIVLELSSFQLENCSGLQFCCAGITYFSPNHLERYATLKEYYRTKYSLVEKTNGPIVCNKNSSDLFTFIKEQKTTKPIDWVEQHGNNLAIAQKIAQLMSWPEVAQKAMLQFPGLPHRMENIGLYKGIQCINDSKATTMESVQMATETALANCKGKLFLLLGGRDKNLPWQSLKDLQKHKQLNILFFGECGEHAKGSSQLHGKVFPNLALALEALSLQAQSGDTILLSPGGTSLDEFKNFEERGHFFTKKIKELFS